MGKGDTQLNPFQTQLPQFPYLNTMEPTDAIYSEVILGEIHPAYTLKDHSTDRAIRSWQDFLKRIRFWLTTPLLVLDILLSGTKHTPRKKGPFQAGPHAYFQVFSGTPEHLEWAYGESFQLEFSEGHDILSQKTYLLPWIHTPSSTFLLSWEAQKIILLHWDTHQDQVFRVVELAPLNWFIRQEAKHLILETADIAGKQIQFQLTSDKTLGV
ncbi:MAG: hypothetical protein AAFQ83_16580 [Bacteroidota bacterium]